jgi:cytochrome P450
MGDLAPDTSGIDLDNLDLTDPDLYQGGASGRAALFKKFRDERPVAFLPEVEIPGFERGPGFWLLTRLDDVMTVSRNPEIFCSGQGTNVPDIPIEIAQFMGSMINMDAPRHTRLRLIVNKSFTPRMVQRIDENVRERARAIVARVADRGTCDIVREIAGPLPLQIICEMMGIPEEQWDRIYECTNIILGDASTSPDFGVLMGAVMEMATIAQTVGEDRLAHPQDDLVSAMMHAEVDGEPLQPMEMASFFILLSAAGNETTRNAITHGVHLLTRTSGRISGRTSMS